MHVYCFMNARGDELVVSRRCAVIISAVAGLCAPRIQNPRGDKWSRSDRRNAPEAICAPGNSRGFHAPPKNNEQPGNTLPLNASSFRRFVLIMVLRALTALLCNRKADAKNQLSLKNISSSPENKILIFMKF